MKNDKIAFGLRLPLSGPLSGADNIIRVAKKAENLNFDAVMAHDSLIGRPEGGYRAFQMGAKEVARPEPTSFECLTTLSFVAGLTSKIHIGADILVLPYGREPITMAKQITTLDVLSNGRYICGVGMGHEGPYRVFVKNPPKYRGRRGDEIIQILKKLWTEPVSSFEGKYFSYTDIAQEPKPVQKPHPPLWIGGRTKFSMNRAARFGDGWMPGPSSVGSPPEFFIESRDYIKERAKKYGRNIDDIKFSWEGIVSIDRTRKAAIEKSRFTVEKRTGPIEESFAFNAIGTPDDIIKKVQEYLEVGVSNFEIKLVDLSIDDIFKSMKLLSEEVFPSFKK